ncbi:hypothetical protein C942_01769 [Photobacterium marinum]|uniref:Uncharacterized protein n=1 Tax=Photobacterium marinum TaxID=1056511 RepID=L8JCS9_9GAMM|nr:hypothetical protein C942_01769 [Photobacterium marinum]
MGYVNDLVSIFAEQACAENKNTVFVADKFGIANAHPE